MFAICGGGSGHSLKWRLELPPLEITLELSGGSLIYEVLFEDLVGIQREFVSLIWNWLRESRLRVDSYRFFLWTSDSSCTCRRQFE